MQGVFFRNIVKITRNVVSWPTHSLSFLSGEVKTPWRTITAITITGYGGYHHNYIFLFRDISCCVVVPKNFTISMHCSVCTAGMHCSVKKWVNLFIEIICRNILVVYMDKESSESNALLKFVNFFRQSLIKLLRTCLNFPLMARDLAELDSFRPVYFNHKEFSCCLNSVLRWRLL